jgi:hypothetical protein
VGDHMNDSQPFVTVLNACRVVSRRSRHSKVVCAGGSIDPRCLTMTVGLAEAQPAVGTVTCQQRRGADLRSSHRWRLGGLGLQLGRTRVAQGVWQEACAGFRCIAAAPRSALAAVQR